MIAEYENSRHHPLHRISIFLRAFQDLPKLIQIFFVDLKSLGIGSANVFEKKRLIICRDAGWRISKVKCRSSKHYGKCANGE